LVTATAGNDDNTDEVLLRSVVSALNNICAEVVEVGIEPDVPHVSDEEQEEEDEEQERQEEEDVKEDTDEEEVELMRIIGYVCISSVFRDRTVNARCKMTGHLFFNFLGVRLFVVASVIVTTHIVGL